MCHVSGRGQGRGDVATVCPETRQKTAKIGRNARGRNKK